MIARLITAPSAPYKTPWTMYGPRMNLLPAPTRRITLISSLVELMVSIIVFKVTKTAITDKIIISDIGAENISTALLKLKESKPEAIMNVDASFYFDSGVRKVRELGITVPIFSQYATEIPGIPELAEGVIYSFPGELSEGPNAIYSLALDTAKFLFPIVLECEGDYDCVREGLINSGEFNDKGVKNRTIILKQIVNGQGVVYE